MTQSMFSFNIAFTQSVNPPDQTVVLNETELWYGIRRGGRNPNDFAPYVASCEVLAGTKNEFRRKLTLADGAVHTAAGEDLIQDVIIAPPLHVQAKTVTTGATSTFLLSHGTTGQQDNERPVLFLTAMYELKLDNVEPGTQAARDIEVNYTALARGACENAVKDIRKWKTEGKLATWQEEDEEDGAGEP
ncbi:uncharacterized protein FMAN_08340 [Fusarium mangiferae]|uniref:Uncharacterized protein n=1 Tax=Fusarium mangiferae TaxID=192010 RepID=A0A1L7TM25_FUSMA|nr:uncharacterized protein FMAN_08340 [Fusarium mangiferae]CVK98969.1 uncharacterized protein FMAN_08340 [Fusarium mangiferae]